MTEIDHGHNQKAKKESINNQKESIKNQKNFKKEILQEIEK